MTNENKIAKQLRGRSLDSRMESLARCLDRLREPKKDAYQRLCAELPAVTGFAPDTLKAGLDLALAQFHRAGLEALIATELGAEANWQQRAPQSTAVIPAGAIPMPTFEALLAPLLLGSTVRIRPSARDLLTAEIFRDALLNEDDLLGHAIQILHFEHNDDAALRTFLNTDAVLAYGSNETLTLIRNQLATKTHFVGYGHRLSIAVATSPPNADLAHALAIDTCLWDQLGCFSPCALYVTEDVKGWVRALATAFEDLCAQLPRGTLPLAAALARRQERDLAVLRGAWLEAGADWTVVGEVSSTWQPAPLYRFLRVYPIPSLDQLETALRPIRPYLSSVAAPPKLHERLQAIGWRRCLAGKMQAPPLDRKHDGIGLLAPLLSPQEI